MKKTRSTRPAVIAPLVLLAALLAFPPAASAKSYSYRAKLSFSQTRPWTHHYQQTTPDCTRTDDGDGLDVARATGYARIGSSNRSVAGFGLVATHTRTGQETHTVSGAECAPSYTYPSTWSIVTQTAGTVTLAESNADCGPKKTKVLYPTLQLVGSHLVLEWPSHSVPDFTLCPFFEGANEASSGNQLPVATYRDVVLKVNRRKLRAGKRRVVATGTSKKAATETCANLTQPCPEGVSYNATASVEAVARVVLTRTKR